MLRDEAQVTFIAHREDELLTSPDPAEALVRWMHPTRGRITPDQFISLAEDSGLILPPGEWVLRTACGKIKSWSDFGLPHIRVSVNVSSRQIEQYNFAEIVRDMIRETGANAAQPDCGSVGRVAERAGEAAGLEVCFRGTPQGSCFHFIIE